ncbi:MAG: arginase family protein [Clostridia bacterium]|nr:arginase family protein [Clostridia bacterium]
MKKHLSILFPQWQGGGILATYEGAMSLEKYYLKGFEYETIPVEMDEDLTVKNNIKGYDPIMRQFATYAELVRERHPETIFTMGGGDDVDILPPAYMNELLDGDMTVAFFDAHGDLNSPESSPSKNLHGMPLRAMLGETDEAILDLMGRPLKPEQIVMIGTRDCDPPEEEYIRAHNMTVVRSEEVNEDAGCVIRSLRDKGSRNIYIHIDIDVIDPEDFPNQPVPAPDGIRKNRFIDALDAIAGSFNIGGICMLGYTRMDDGLDPAIKRIVDMGMKQSF